MSLTKSTLVGGLLSAVCLYSSPGQALTITGTGVGFAIPDANPAGQSSTISISQDVALTGIQVTLSSLSHTWLGDLIATLSKPSSGQTVTLFSRIGRVNTGLGDSSNFGGTYRFSDSFTGDLWAAAAGGDGSFSIPSGDYFASGANSAAKLNILGVFAGTSSLGDWVLNISDFTGGDAGTLGSWELSLTGDPTAVPAPLPLLGAAAAFRSSRRIRRRLRANVGNGSNDGAASAV